MTIFFVVFHWHRHSIFVIIVIVIFIFILIFSCLSSSSSSCRSPSCSSYHLRLHHSSSYSSLCFVFLLFIFVFIFLPSSSSSSRPSSSYLLVLLSCPSSLHRFVFACSLFFSLLCLLRLVFFISFSSVYLRLSSSCLFVSAFFVFSLCRWSLRNVCLEAIEWYFRLGLRLQTPVSFQTVSSDLASCSQATSGSRTMTAEKMRKREEKMRRREENDEKKRRGKEIACAFASVIVAWESLTGLECRGT